MKYFFFCAFVFIAVSCSKSTTGNADIAVAKVYVPVVIYGTNMADNLCYGKFLVGRQDTNIVYRSFFAPSNAVTTTQTRIVQIIFHDTVYNYSGRCGIKDIVIDDVKY
jgi:hypothetical protein